MATAAPTETEIPPLPSYEEAMKLPYIPYPAAPQPSHAMAMQEPCPPQVYPPPVNSPPEVSVRSAVLQQTLGDHPVEVQCPVCLQIVVTRLEHSLGIMTWLFCAGLCILGCFYGCCLLPFCWDGLKDVTHFCPNCYTIVGVFKRM